MRVATANLEYLAAHEAAVTAATVARHLRNAALFAFAPLVALVYVVAFPFVGLGMLAWMAVKAAR